MSGTASRGKPICLQIKQNPAQGAPLVVDMKVGGSFISSMTGEDIDYSMRGFGSHAMCVTEPELNENFIHLTIIIVSLSKTNQIIVNGKKYKL